MGKYSRAGESEQQEAACFWTFAAGADSAPKKNTGARAGAAENYAAPVPVFL